jgi:hypothetical protein
MCRVTHAWMRWRSYLAEAGAAGGGENVACGCWRLSPSWVWRRPGVAVRVCSAPEQRDGGGDQAWGDGEVEGGGQAVAEGWADDRGEEGTSGAAAASGTPPTESTTSMFLRVALE